MNAFHRNITACMRCPHGQGADGPRLCLADSKGIGTIERATAGNCPIGQHVADDGTELPATAARVQASVNGAWLWKALHRRALDAAADLSEEVRWLELWSNMIPCGDCKATWAAWRITNPANLSSPAAYFAWTIGAHNFVNRKLGRREWTVNEALAAHLPA